MDLQKIEATHYIGSVQITSDDFDYVRLCTSHHGIQVNENLKDYEEELLEICGDISDKMYKLKELINKSKL